MEIVEKDVDTFLLFECGKVIGQFNTAEEAQQYIQDTWGEGQRLEWKRKDGKPRMLVYEQFCIIALMGNN